MYSSGAKVDDHGNGKFFLWTVDRDWLLPFSLQFGEMLYQLRAALDSCVYDAAVLEFAEYPPPDEERWNFAICDSPEKFNDAARRMKNLPDRLRTLLESVQPYSGATGRAEGKEWDLGLTLYILNDWARIDRHRRLHLVGTALNRGQLGFTCPPGMSIESCDFLSGEYLLEDNTEIARFRIVNFVPGAQVQVHSNFSLEIVVNEVPRLKLQDAALAMGLSVSAVRERFEQSYGINR